MWYRHVRPALFALAPERAHRFALWAARIASRLPVSRTPGAPVELMGLKFSNRVGLAAGFDKNAEAVDGLARLGFGFIEIGTVTPRPQPGQPPPRLFRLKTRNALVNRLGFPNVGAQAIASRLMRRRYRGVLGINIGKNADTPILRALDDYVACLRILHDSGFRAVADIAQRLQLDGLIVANTTLQWNTMEEHDLIGGGGLSGTPLHSLAVSAVSALRALT